MSRPAAPMTRVLSHARFQAAILLRNGEQVLVSIILPLFALFGLDFASVPTLPSPRIDTIAPGVLALAVVSTAFTGQAISTGFDRRYGVLRLLGVSPLGRTGLLAGKAIAVGLVLVVQVVVLGGTALALGWRPSLAGLPALIATLVLGVAAFVPLALVVAGTLRAEAVLAVANLLWVIFLGFGLLIPLSTLPDVAAPIASIMPSGALGEAARTAGLQGRVDLWHWLILVAWGAAASAAASRWFRWSD